MYNYEEHKKFVYTDEGIKIIIDIMIRLNDSHSLNARSILESQEVEYTYNVLACFDWLEENKLVDVFKEDRYKRDWDYQLREPDYG